MVHASLPSASAGCREGGKAHAAHAAHGAQAAAYSNKSRRARRRERASAEALAGAVEEKYENKKYETHEGYPVSTPRSSWKHELNHDSMNDFAASVAGPERGPVIAHSDR